MSTAYRWGRAGAAAALLIGTLLASGCGSDTTASSSDSTSATSAASSAPVTAATVDVKDMQFSPDSVTLKVGGTVTWKFADRFPHAVQGIGDSAMGINSPIFNAGEWSHTFAIPGTYRYLCPLHPDMHGTITVVP
ncbi:plastocyanin/azurin family copper-binding protein [Nocardia alni]|uniref:plastocyanin/azurin family copper-binding protein n=1 Tax=Nocardia alni TaxID=2815723 RepID=UPI001C23ED07|nr:plastocyanin/azurin family copper-binding protein [Nocardia alni]